ncbi:MAG: radical SAM protein [Deltaproteobacteria bacterium]|nr:radical SAM protein [Deltaproteobacteria bacterium]MBW1918656.1 radical SAM protein [Deltaproteobacteria bacterium]MBW1933970.1 radical SAM protein [Deltaproteobacteria bacterium]MBW1976611.1 radical SAM protein [Deltaproteobacteria bacterium]MBW2043283.1 radical SAM protein [Deltaproteobacteria bacterium]
MRRSTNFEQGPIRPPNEAQSLLLRVTRNCPWNQCLFCPVYKNQKFSLRSVEEIKQDIQTVRDIVDDIKAVSWKLGFSGRINNEVVSHIFSSPDYSSVYRSVAGWLYYGTGACFLQDADNLVMKTDDLVSILKFLREKLPEVTRVTTYSRSRTIVRKSVESLKRIKDAGLDRVHVGLESGYDPILKFMKKGVTAAQHIEAGQKVVQAGLELSEYVMPGLGGQDLWKEHALASAKVLNKINPHFIRLRSLRVPDRVPLFEKLQSGEFKMQTDDMLAEEIRLFIETLDGITSTVTSDHIMNLLEEVSGRLPEGKEKMLAVIKKYQELPDSERLIYRVGRRGGVYRSISDLEADPVTYEKIKDLIKDLEARGGREQVEKFITEMVDQYV